MLWSAFLIGFLGSFHCAVMCAPIMLSVKWSGISSLKVLSNKLVYQSGRILTYVLIGLLFYALGRSFALTNFQKALSVVAGSLLLIWVFISQFKLHGFNAYLFNFFGYLKKALTPLVNIKGPIGSLFTGILNGLLPCGLVYVAAFASVAQTSAINSAAFMLFFGLGTLPLLIAVMGGVQLAGKNLKVQAYKLTPIFISLLGMFFILRGLELGIPYISPTLGAGVNGSSVICAPLN